MVTDSRQSSLPIWAIASDIVAAMTAGNRLVLVAPTGSGKSTQVPQMMVDQLKLPGKIVVLQPRRVAARTLAQRVAWEREGRVGHEVGYQVRFEDFASRGTRIMFVTEGILLRWLQDDPELKDVSAILFDEFHERNLLSDVALGLVKRLQEKSRPELKLLVMSATLDAEPVAKYLNDAPILISQGTMYAVEVNFLENRDARPVSEQAAQAVEQLINAREAGDILVFMPGMAEISATIAQCRHLRIAEQIDLLALHGELPPAEQDRAFAPSDLRKVIVSTNVAETSVTIDGVRHVVDGGLARISRFDSERGIGTLFVEEISRASADQRKGRAGRTGPGTCTRLWTESNHLNRPERNTPEIQRADLSEVVLLLHSLGVTNASKFDWLDQPDPAAVSRAERLLRTLGALRNEATDGPDITEIGRKMLRLPMHPRYSRMLVEAASRDCVVPAALCAALTSGRDLLLRLGRDDKHIEQAREGFQHNEQSDFFTLIQAFNAVQQSGFNLEVCRRYAIHAGSAREVALTFRQFLDVLKSQKLLDEAGLARDTWRGENLQRAIAAGFIDQLCARKDQGSLDCRLTEGRTGTLMRESVVQSAPLFTASVIKEVSSKSGPITLLGLATAVHLTWLQEMFPQHLSTSLEHLYDRTHKRVAAIKITRFQDLELAREHAREIDPAEAGRALARAHLEGMFELPNFSHDLKQFVNRVNLIVQAAPELEFPPFDRPALESALARAFTGLTLAKEAQTADLKVAIHGHLAPEQRGWLDELAPQTWKYGDSKPLKLSYPENAAKGDALPYPELQLKLHECFGLSTHPRLVEGKVPVKLWLASPDGKRLEPTVDWPEFRAKSYPKLKPGLQKKFPGFTWL